MIKPRELNNWMSQVKNSELEAEDYDFIEKAVHGGKNGNKGLANFGAHLAVYGENGEKIVDEGLVERLDQVQEEYESVRKRERFQNIAQRIKNQEESGHQLLEDMVSEFKNNTTYQNPENSVRLNGGETMTNIEEMVGEIETDVNNIYSFLDELPGEETYDDLKSNLDELTDKAEAARDNYFDVRDELDEAHDELDTIYESLESAHERVEQAEIYVSMVAADAEASIEDAVSEAEAALDEAYDQVDEAGGYMEEILEDDIPEMPERSDRVEEQLS